MQRSDAAQCLREAVKYLKSCERSRESEGKFTVPKEVCEVRRYCTYRLRNVKDVKDRDGVLNSSGGTGKKIDYIFTNSFFSTPSFLQEGKEL